MYYNNEYFSVEELTAHDENYLQDLGIFINEKEAPHNYKVTNMLTQRVEYYSSALAQAIAYADQHNQGLIQFLEGKKKDPTIGDLPAPAANENSRH